MSSKILITIALTIEELQKVLLPHGGTITEINVEQQPIKRRKAAPKKTPSASPKKAGTKK
jgi:hypothetical protein